MLNSKHWLVHFTHKFLISNYHGSTCKHILTKLTNYLKYSYNKYTFFNSTCIIIKQTISVNRERRNEKIMFNSKYRLIRFTHKCLRYHLNYYQSTCKHILIKFNKLLKYSENKYTFFNSTCIIIKQ